jgi:hypothetical protein
MTLREILSIRDSINKLANSHNLPIKVMYAAGKALKQIQDFMDAHNKKNTALYNELGQFVMVPDPADPTKKIQDREGRKEIIPENMDKYNEKYNALLDEDVGEIYDFKINLSDLKSDFVYLKEFTKTFNEKVDDLIVAMKDFEKNPKDDFVKAKLEILRKEVMKISSNMNEKVESLKNTAQFAVLDFGNLQHWIVDDSNESKAS